MPAAKNSAQPVEPIIDAVYPSILAVAAALAEQGIGKNNQTGGKGDFSFKFRGIDDVVLALSPLLIKHKLIIAPVSTRSVIEKQDVVDSNGKPRVRMHASAQIIYRIVSAIDGTSMDVEVPGEGMDSTDKASNKAMASAYKYMVLQAFCVPTAGVQIDVESDIDEEPVASANVKGAETDKKETNTAPVDNDAKAREAYMRLATEFIPMARTRDDLVEWYRDEGGNRKKAGLTETDEKHISALCAKQVKALAAEADPFA